jgi:hypothetical protein
MLKTLVSGHYTLDSWNLYMIVEKRGGIITVVKALVSRQDTLEVPVNLFLWKNPHCLLSFSGESVATGLPVGDWPKHYCRHLTWDTRHPCYTADLDKKPRRLEPII